MASGIGWGVLEGLRARPCLAVAALVAISACSASRASVELGPVTPAPTGVHNVGQFVWHDLVTDDPEAAKRFYGGMFGWEFEDVPGDPVLYSVIHHMGVPIGGVARMNDDDPAVSTSRWLSLMSVEDVDRAVDRVLRAGGGVIREAWDDATRGRLAVVADPQGATVAFVRSRGGDPPNLEASDLVSGRWMWIELWARDVSAAVTLYASVAGYSAESTDVFDAPGYRVLTRDGHPRAGVNEIPWPEVQPNWLPYIKVDDPQAMARRARDLGGTVLIPPLPEVRDGSAGLILDPTGAAFAIQRWPINVEAPAGGR